MRKLQLCALNYEVTLWPELIRIAHHMYKSIQVEMVFTFQYNGIQYCLQEGNGALNGLGSSVPGSDKSPD